MKKISEIIENKDMFSSILETIHNGLLLIDKNKKILYANSNITQMFNLDLDKLTETYGDEILGNFLSCEHDCSHCKGCHLDSCIKDTIKCEISPKPIREELEFKNKNGEIKYLKFSIIPILNNNEKLLFIAFDDITEEKTLYKELEIKHYRLKNMTESLENSDSIVMAVANSVEAKDPLTKGHISRVAYFAQKIGEQFKMTEKELQFLKKGAILHDIGKIGTPDNILNKPGPLTDEEFEIMKKHPEDGWKILKSLKTFQNIADIVRHHHEKLDGTGYPDRILGKDIDIYTRIVAIVDIYDALVADRPYRKALSREVALEIIYKDVEKGKLDRAVADALTIVSKTNSFDF